MDLYLNRPVINGTLKWTSRYLNPSVDQPVLNLFVYFDFKTVKRPSARLSALRLKKDLRELKQNINSWRHRDIIITSLWRHSKICPNQSNAKAKSKTEIHLSSVRSIYLPNEKSPSNKPCHGNIYFCSFGQKLSMTSNRLQNKLLKKFKGSSIVDKNDLSNLENYP